MRSDLLKVTMVEDQRTLGLKGRETQLSPAAAVV
jgi:hypothetical protein